MREDFFCLKTVDVLKVLEKEFKFKSLKVKKKLLIIFSYFLSSYFKQLHIFSINIKKRLHLDTAFVEKDDI